MTVQGQLFCALLICTVVGINEGCVGPLGMKDKTIPNSSITASSALVDPNDNVFVYNGYEGRLDAGFFWIPESNEGSWVQVDFGYPNIRRINGIITQGSVWWKRWVETLQVQYGNSTDALMPILDGGVSKTFAANIDPTRHKTIIFPETIEASVIRIVPIRWHDSVGLRWEILGCEPDSVQFADPSACAKMPCHNQGQCVDFSHPTDYACVCTGQFLGDTCEYSYNFCSTEPCNNNGTCKDFGSTTDYFCDCLDSYFGVNCDDYYAPFVHPCVNFPCKNGGECHGTVANPYCTCPFPYGGKYCAKWAGKYIAMVVSLVLIAVKVIFWCCCCCCKALLKDEEEITGNDVKLEAKATQEPLVEEKV